MAQTSVNNKLLDSHFTWGVVALFVLGTIIYVFPVGQIQPGHYLAPIIILIGASFIRWRDLNPGDKWLSVFGFYTLVINGYYYFSLQNVDFLFSIFYWGYNVLLFIALSHLLSHSSRVRSVLPYAFLLCIAIILILWSVGYLRVNIFDNRFMGQFNDPNQMGNWLLCAFIGLFFLTDKGVLRNRYFQLLILIIVALLISAASSRSATFGLVPLLIGFIWLRFFREKLSLPKPVLVLILGVAIVSIVAILGTKVNTHVDMTNLDSSLKQEMPLKRLLTTDWQSEAKLRGYFRPSEYPKYLIFGAGHGDEARFNSEHEIHSSFLSVFFYYGVFGLILFLGFLHQVFRRLSLPEALMLSAPFVYGLFTYGFRTPIFWVLMAIVVATRPIILNAHLIKRKASL